MSCATIDHAIAGLKLNERWGIHHGHVEQDLIKAIMWKIVNLLTAVAITAAGFVTVTNGDSFPVIKNLTYI